MSHLDDFNYRLLEALDAKVREMDVGEYRPMELFAAVADQLRAGRVGKFEIAFLRSRAEVLGYGWTVQDYRSGAGFVVVPRTVVTNTNTGGK